MPTLTVVCLLDSRARNRAWNVCQIEAATSHNKSLHRPQLCPRPHRDCLRANWSHHGVRAGTNVVSYVKVS